MHVCACICVFTLLGDKHTCEMKVYRTQEEGTDLSYSLIILYSSKTKMNLGLGQDVSTSLSGGAGGEPRTQPPRGTPDTV